MTTKTVKPAATKVVEDTVAAAKQSYEAATKAVQDATAQNVEQALVSAQDQFEKATSQFLKGFDEISAYSKGNFDAVVTASSTLFRGVEDMTRAVFALQHSAVEQSMAVAKQLLAAKSLREVVDLQSGFTRSTFDEVVAKTNELSELGIKVANETIAPINARVTVAVEKLSKPIAA